MNVAHAPRNSHRPSPASMPGAAPLLAVQLDHTGPNAGQASADTGGDLTVALELIEAEVAKVRSDYDTQLAEASREVATTRRDIDALGIENRNLARRLADALGRLGDAESDVEALAERVAVLEQAPAPTSEPEAESEPKEDPEVTARREREADLDRRIMELLRAIAAAGVPWTNAKSISQNLGNEDYRLVYRRLKHLRGTGLVAQERQPGSHSMWAAA